MRNRLAHYIQLRRAQLPRAKAASMSGIDRYAGRALHLAGWIVCGLTVLLILSGQATALSDAADNRFAAKVANQAGEIEQLRKIVAACLGKREGAIFIGNELHLCRAVPTGVKQ